MKTLIDPSMINNLQEYINAAVVAAAAGMLPSASYTAADVLAKIKTVDGVASGLDADTLDGIEAALLAKINGSNTFSAEQIIQAASTSAQLKLQRTATSIGSSWLGVDDVYALNVFKGDLSSKLLALTQTGHLLLPTQPAFYSYSGGIGPATTGSYPAGSTSGVSAALITNKGSHFNVSTGRFTAPVAGTYEFHGSVSILTGTSNVGITPRKNGGTVGFQALAYGGVLSASNHAILTLAVGDWVDMSVSFNNGASSQVYGSMFSGSLIS